MKLFLLFTISLFLCGKTQIVNIGSEYYIREQVKINGDYSVQYAGDGISSSILYYNGSDAVWFDCAVGTLILKDLTISSPRTDTADIQFYIWDRCQLEITNVLFDGRNYNLITEKTFWLIEGAGTKAKITKVVVRMLKVTENQNSHYLRLF